MTNSELSADTSARRKPSRKICEAQTRLMVAEHSAMVTRMVAALTHELNSPLGALVSPLDTARGVLARVRTGGVADNNRLAQVEAQLGHAGHDARKQIDQVIFRIQRYANLYGANRTSVLLAELMDDVIALLDPTLLKATAIHLDIPGDLAADCRPDQISAVGSILLHHLMETRQGSPIAVTGADLDGAACIRISSRALVLTAEEMRCLAIPGESAPCTWNFYAARQILSQGGDLRVTSCVENGTVFDLLLPLPRESHGSKNQ